PCSSPDAGLRAQTTRWPHSWLPSGAVANRLNSELGAVSTSTAPPPKPGVAPAKMDPAGPPTCVQPPAPALYWYLYTASFAGVRPNSPPAPAVHMLAGPPIFFHVCVTSEYSQRACMPGAAA